MLVILKHQGFNILLSWIYVYGYHKHHHFFRASKSFASSLDMYWWCSEKFPCQSLDCSETNKQKGKKITHKFPPAIFKSLRLSQFFGRSLEVPERVLENWKGLSDLFIKKKKKKRVHKNLSVVQYFSYMHRALSSTPSAIDEGQRLLHGLARKAVLKMTELRHDCLEEANIFLCVLNTLHNDFFPLLCFHSSCLSALYFNSFWISKWKIKGKRTMIKQFRDYIMKGRTQAVKQVSTTKPQTPTDWKHCQARPSLP